MKILISDAKKDTKLPAILQAALKLFVEKGIDGTGIRDIARAAGVAEGALYRHFKSKEDLAWHLFADNLKAFTGDLMVKVLAAKETKARISLLVEACFESYEKNRALFHFLILSEHRDLGKYTKQYLHPGKLIERIIEDGLKSKELREDEPWLLFSQVFGTIHRMCVLRTWGLVKSPLTGLSAKTADGIWLAVKR